MKLKPCFFAAAILLTGSLFAQSGTADINEHGKPDKEQKSDDSQPRNLFKINLAAIPLKNYSFQYERVLTKAMSLAVGYNNMPKGPIPLKTTFKKAVANEDPQLTKIIDNLETANWAITPELRFYLSKKGYGRGFYLAPFYRHASFTVNNLLIDYENNASVKNTITLSGNLTSNTGGLQIGTQTSLGKHFGLDFWLLGAHYGTAKGTFSGISNKPLTPDEQTDLRNKIDDLNIGKLKATVTASGATVVYDGPWGGLRGGLCLVFKF
ncbi:MAG: DUF3575 domain-containing protein [Chitinophagaceae bacterium]